MSESQSLKFGDTVLLQVQTKEQSGYVYSELSGSSYNFLTLFPVPEKHPNFVNIKYAAFKVLVPNKYKSKQRLNDLQRRGAEEYLLARAMAGVKAEDSENEQEQSRRLGTNVSFGDSIQLQHAASKKYVSVRSEAAKAESNNLLVNLSAENSEGVIFKILPKYKVRSEGDDVRYGDQMKLESIKTQGQYLHVSGPTRTLGAAGFNVLSKCFEVNLSSTDSALTLVYHQSPLDSDSNKALQAGSCVRLFHKEDECYIVAEGSFAKSSPVVEDVHCRQRRVDLRKHAQPSTSSITYWQIEKEVDPRSGDTLFWEESCRIKHLPTKLYLCVTKNHEVTLKQRCFDKSDFDTLFSFYPLIREGDEVLFESYASIKHILTGQWLHLDREHYKRKNFNPEEKGLAGLQWDSAELFKLSTRPNRGDYDSFAIQQVEEDLLDKFNYVAGIVPVLTAHISHIQGDKVVGLTEKQSLRVKETLIELRRWLVTLDSRDTKDRQKLLRNLRVLEQLAEILKSGDHVDIKKSQVEICKECYNVFKRYLEGDSRKNENYLARFIELFQSQMRKGLNAEEVLVEIVQDNLNIVSKMAETRMEHMIEQFCTTQDPRFLYFLSSLCVCNDRPIPSTQNRLLENLVLKRGKEFFLRVEVIGNDTGEKAVMYYRQDSPSNKKTVRSLKPFGSVKKRMSIVGNPSTVNRDYDLLEAQLHLFGRLCKGNNELALRSLMHSKRNPEGYIDFEQAHMCAKDQDIDVMLRSKYVELILVMFVDVGNNRPFLDNLCYSFIYNDLVPSPYADTGDDDFTALTGEKNEHFTELKTWLLTTVESQTALDCDSSSTDENNLLEQIIDILGHLVRFGYYDNEEDVNKMMKPLIKLLDDSTDVENLTGKDETSVYSVKLKALEVMELFFRFKFYVKLQKFMYEFQVLHDDGNHDMPEILEQLLQSQDELGKKLHEKETRMAVMNRLKFLCDDSDRGGGFAPHGVHGIPNLEEVLLNLSKRDCNELVTASLGLLTEMYFFEDELFSKAQQAQLLISPTSIKHYKKVAHEIFPELLQLLRVDSDQKNQDRMIKLVQDLSDLCILPMETGILELNTENQIMLDNFGLVSEILSYILTKGSEDQGLLPSISDDSMETSVRDYLFSVCLCLLRYLATGRISVQKRLFNRIDDLLELKVPGHALADVADLLTEVFTGGPELVFKASEQHIERIFEIIVSNENATVQAQFLLTLQAMAKIEELDIPYGHNQALIIKNFCRLRESFCSEFLSEGQEMVKKRIDILKKPQAQELDPQQQLLMGFADLLATCAEAKDQFIESVCQNIFSIEELVEIMCSNDISPVLKRPFVRFLIMVYMKVDVDKPEARVGSNTLTHGSEIWKYLEHLADLLKNIATALCSIPSEEEGYVKNQLSSSNRRRNSFSSQSPQYPGSRLPRGIATGIQHVTDDKGELMPGLLEYMADGIIPFLQAFYNYFFDPDDAASENDRDNEYFISAQIAKSLSELSDQLVKFFSSETSLILYQSTIKKLLSYEEIKCRAEINPKKKLFVQRSQDTATPPASAQPRRFTLQRGGTMERSSIPEEPVSEETLKEYENQRELNDSFNLFAINYQAAYCGPNLASVQISSTVEKLEYSEEGEELPLGPSFQHLVGMFFSYTQGSAFSLVGAHPGDLVKKEVKKEIKEVAERLLAQLEISFSQTEQLSERDQVKQDILDVRCLQILRAMIHNQIKEIDPELKDRDPKKFRRKSSMLVVPVQNTVQSFKNGIKRVIPLLSHPNESIAKEALALMKALLFSGNKTVQDGIVQAVKETREEKLFAGLKTKLELASIRFKEIKDLEEQLFSRKRSKHRLSSEIALVEEPEMSSLPTTQPAQLETSQKNGNEVVIEMEVVHKPDKKQESIDDSHPLLVYQETTPLHGSLIRGSSTDHTHDTSASLHGSNKDHDLLSQVLTSDNTWTSLVLEVTGLMCDGQHRVLQDYLREQPDNFKSLNVISEICELLQTYTNDLTRNENLEEIYHILQSLIETCVGNFKNQKVIFYKQVMEPIDKILQIPLDDLLNECTRVDDENSPASKLIEEIIQVKGSAVELLTIMLEETNPETKSIAKGLGSSLDEDVLLKVMQEFHELKSHGLVRKMQMDDDCERGMFRTYHIIASLINYGAGTFCNRGEVRKRYKDRNGSKELPSEFSDYTRSIEIHYEEEECKPILAKINFPFNPNSTLREEITEQVRWNINRDSMEDKQTSLLSLLPALKRDINHQIWLKGPLILKPFLASYVIRVKILILLTVLLNLFALFLFEVPNELSLVNRKTDNKLNESLNGSNSAFLPATAEWFNPILYLLGTLHLILSIMVVIDYFLINWPHFTLPQFFYTTWADVTRLFSKDRNKPLVRLPQFTLLDVNILGISTIYMIIFLLSSILSLAFSGYFYSICLLYIIVNNDILIRVLRAVTKNGISLIWVAILGVIVLFIYSVISFAFYHNQFYTTDDADLFCETLAQCMYSVIRYGLIDNIGLLVPQTSDTYKSTVQPVRLIYDISFFIIVTTIGLNIVFGIIVDTFGELREERSEIEEEQRSKCFICDLPSYEFERRGEGFKNHVKLSHNMWDYVYYSLYLDNIDTGDHTAIQKYVYKMIEDGKTGFFPQEEAGSLPGEEDTTGQSLDQLQSKVEFMLKRFREKEHAKSIYAKREHQKKLEKEISEHIHDKSSSS